jgi:cyanate permease
VAPPVCGLIVDITGGFRGMWMALALVVVLALFPAAFVREPATGRSPSSR